MAPRNDLAAGDRADHRRTGIQGKQEQAGCAVKDRPDEGPGGAAKATPQLDRRIGAAVLVIVAIAGVTLAVTSSRGSSKA